MRILDAISAKDIHALRRFAEDPNLDPDDGELIAGFAEDRADWSIARRLISNPVMDPNTLWQVVVYRISVIAARKNPDAAAALNEFALTADRWAVDVTHEFVSTSIWAQQYDALVTAAGLACHPQGFIGENLDVFHTVDEELRLRCEVAVANNPHATGLLLTAWADHEAFEVRNAVAFHPHSPDDAQALLAEEFAISDGSVA